MRWRHISTLKHCAIRSLLKKFRAYVKRGTFFALFTLHCKGLKISSYFCK